MESRKNRGQLGKFLADGGKKKMEKGEKQTTQEKGNLRVLNAKSGSIQGVKGGGTGGC